MSLVRKTTSGFFWTISNQFSLQLINFIVLIVLSRVLSPEAFGLVAMLQVFIGIGTSLMDSGMTSSLIRSPDVNERDYSSVFFTNIFASLFIYAIIFVCAPLIAGFYKQPALTNLVRVFSLAYIVQAFVGVQTARLVKEMNFRLQLFMQLPATIIGSAVGIWMAYKGWGVWSLVYLNLVKAFVFMIQHWFRTSWRPVFIIDKLRLKKHFSFGYKLTLVGLLNAIYSNTYNILIGKFFSPLQVGYYSQANTFSLFPVDMVSTALDKVTYPLFAEIQSDKARLKLVYKKIMQQVVFWSVPLMLLLIIVARPVFSIVLTDEWLPAVPYFQILCLYAMMHPLQVYNVNILKVVGRTDLLLKIEIVKKVTGIVGVLAIAVWGIYPLLWFKVIYALFLFYMNTRYSGRMIDYGMKEQVRDILPIFLAGFGVAAVCWLINNWLLAAFQLNVWITLVINGVIFIVLYTGLAWLTKMAPLFDMRQILGGNRLLGKLVPGVGKQEGH